MWTFFLQAGQLFKTALLQSSDLMSFGVCLDAVTSKLLACRDEIEKWFLFCRQIPGWVGTGEFANHRKALLCRKIEEFAKVLKDQKQKFQTAPKEENW